jgi:zinc transporter 7
MGIAIHNVSTSDADIESLDLTAGVRQSASGLLGTTVQLADLVSPSPDESSLIEFDVEIQVIPFVAGGFLYIGAVAVLPT